MKKNVTFMECIDSLFRMPQFRSGLQAEPPCRLFVGSASKPGSESIRRASVWASAKNQTRDLSGGLCLVILQILELQRAQEVVFRPRNACSKMGTFSESSAIVPMLEGSRNGPGFRAHFCSHPF